LSSATLGPFIPVVPTVTIRRHKHWWTVVSVGVVMSHSQSEIYMIIKALKVLCVVTSIYDMRLTVNMLLQRDYIQGLNKTQVIGYLTYT